VAPKKKLNVLEERIESGKEFQIVGATVWKKARTENKIGARNL